MLGCSFSPVERNKVLWCQRTVYEVIIGQNYFLYIKKLTITLVFFYLSHTGTRYKLLQSDLQLDELQ